MIPRNGFTLGRVTHFLPATLSVMFVSLVAVALLHSQGQTSIAAEYKTWSSPVDIRVATFNVEDIRESDLSDPNHPRLRRIGSVIREMRPNIILLNEIAYDGPGSPGHREGDQPGQLAQRFVETFVHAAGDGGQSGIRYRAFMAPVNTGMHSGFDLDNDGRVVSTFPLPMPSNPDGTPPRQTNEQRAYGNDAWGFGTFPGQYGMALLVDERLEIVSDRVRTFRLMPWDYVPGAFVPRLPETNEPWYDADEWAIFRLSSKSHWDIPVRLPNGQVIHLLCSHPTPPAFDGPEMRNQKRNHDEIRFWADYLDRAAYIVDDLNQPGGLDPDAHFVILGDLNADPEKGNSFKNPIKRNLFANTRINSSITPVSDLAVPGLEPSDTAMFKLRVDYVLPSRTLEPIRAGVWRSNPEPVDMPFPSDHFPVWMDVRVPAP
ncbi:MAG: endonuclease/exonuclease/phosphatase family protein [Phycisphaeraceae bacterium]|nr:endonuclease/exonuclease/phosphatase family protein [Phycisphaeraceae bacterium]